MTNTLKVVKPFFVLEEGDVMERTDRGTYETSFSSEYSVNDDSDEISSSYLQKYEISESYANSLVREGFLSEVKSNNSFKNVFDEIDRLLDLYKNDLHNLAKDMENAPACMKVEKETVLSNLVKTMDYLKSLKK